LDNYFVNAYDGVDKFGKLKETIVDDAEVEEIDEPSEVEEEI
jgi:hypothetical protein